MSEKIDVSHIVAFSEATAEADFWRKRSLMNAALRDVVERENTALKLSVEKLTAENEKLKGAKNGGK